MRISAIALTVLSSLITAPAHAYDFGYPEGRLWADFNRDGLMDLCRVVGNPGNYMVWCTLGTKRSHNESDPPNGPTIKSSALDRGEAAGRAWIDVNADSTPDFCRVTGPDLQQQFIGCLISQPGGIGFSYEVRRAVDAGHDWSRFYADVNRDSIPDFCRKIGDYHYRTQTVCATTRPGSVSPFAGPFFEDVNSNAVKPRPSKRRKK